MMRRWLWATICLMSAAYAEDATMLRWGFDERARQDVFNNIPVKRDPPGVAREGMNDFFRLRTRVWVEVDPLPKLTLRARALEEFRYYILPNPPASLQRSNYHFPEEVIFDNLYVEARDLVGDNLDIRIGRQELRYGNGRVFSDGTPKDASRTTYFNALKATWKGWSDTRLDLIGIYNPPIDKLALNSSDRDLTGYTSSANNDDVTDSGAGAYLTVNRWADCPLELYGFYQHLTAWVQAPLKDKQKKVLPAAAGQTLNASQTVLENGSLDRGTCGFRVAPHFSDQLTGNLEAAVQFGKKGEADILAWMVDAGVTNQLPVLCDYKPAVFAGFYFLSGSDPNSSRLDGWHAPWARDLQDSRITALSFDADGYFDWTNLMRPSVGVICSPCSRLTTTLIGSYLSAPEADGSGGGHERGWLGQAAVDFTLAHGLFAKHDKLGGFVWFQVLKPGDYYDDNALAYFFRWQLKYEF